MFMVKSQSPSCPCLPITVTITGCSHCSQPHIFQRGSIYINNTYLPKKSINSSILYAVLDFSFYKHVLEILLQQWVELPHFFFKCKLNIKGMIIKKLCVIYFCQFNSRATTRLILSFLGFTIK